MTFRGIAYLSSIALFSLVSVTHGARRAKISIDVHYELDCGDDFEGCEQANSTTTTASQSPTNIAQTTVAHIISPTENTVQSPSTTIATEPTTTTVPRNFTCLAKGNFGDPKDCRSYYNCDDITKPVHNTCFVFFHFDNKTSKCEWGIC